MAVLTPVQRFLGLIQSDRKAVINIYIYSLFNGLVALSLPLGIQAIISFIQAGQLSASWIVLVLIVILGIIISGWLQVLQLKTSEQIQQRIFTKSALELAFRIPKIKSEELYRFFAPELANRFFDTLSIQKGLSKILLDFSGAIMQILFGLLLLSFYHPFFILFAVLIAIMLFAIIRLTFYRGMETSLQESQFKYQTAHWLEEIARSVFSFKLKDNSNYHVQKTDEIVHDYLKARQSHFRILLKQYWSMIGFKAALALSLLLVGGFLVINQNMSIGQFVAAEIIILLVIASMEKLILSAETIYDVFTALEKIGTITDLELESDTRGIVEIECPENSGIDISAKGISFSYPESKHQILDNITLDVSASSKIAIAGKSSSGKASLLNLISTLYKPTEGIVQYNGINLNDMNLKNIRNHIGSYLTSEELFEGSLYENITLAREKATYENIIWALEKTSLSDYVNKLPEGLKTKLKPTGKPLSQSIVQKILLARAIATKPQLLVLGNNLDKINEKEKRKIFEFLCDSKNSWTLLFASNDKNLVELSDTVVFLNDGVIQGIDTYKKMLSDSSWPSHFLPQFFVAFVPSFYPQFLPGLS